MDSTLTIAGAAADAEKTGEFTEILNNLINQNHNIIPELIWTQGKYVNKNTNTITNGGNQLYITDYIPIPTGTFKINCDKIISISVAWTISFYDTFKHFISGDLKTATYESPYVI